jgi:hypothetical protein
MKEPLCQERKKIERRDDKGTLKKQKPLSANAIRGFCSKDSAATYSPT